MEWLIGSFIVICIAASFTSTDGGSAPRAVRKFGYWGEMGEGNWKGNAEERRK